MTQLNATDIFREAYEDSHGVLHKNFMTPHVIRYGRKGEYVYELSKGEGFTAGSTIYGLTVVHYDEQKKLVTKCHELSDCYHSEGDVEKAIKNLPRYKI